MKKAMLYIVALMFSAGVNAAANFDFVNEADVVQGEFGALAINFSDDGIGLTATASADGVAANAYLDENGGSGPAGLGVCKVLTGDQCNPSSDDNVLNGENLILTFDQNVWVSDVTFNNGAHETDFDGTFELIIDTVSQGTYNLAALVAIDLYGTTFEFINNSGLANAGNRGSQFYVATLNASVPVPAAVFLFAPALLGFFGLRRKATLAA